MKRKKVVFKETIEILGPRTNAKQDLDQDFEDETIKNSPERAKKPNIQKDKAPDRKVSPPINDEDAPQNLSQLKIDPDFDFSPSINKVDTGIALDDKDFSITETNSTKDDSLFLSNSPSINSDKDFDFQDNVSKETDMDLSYREVELRLLDQCKFDFHLRILRLKKNKIERIYGEKEKEDYQIALESLEELLESLGNAKYTLLRSNTSLKVKFKVFEASCVRAIEEASITLNQHRGWSQFFAKFMSIIMSMCSLFMANLISGRGVFGLFRFKTDSAKKLDAMKIRIKYVNSNVQGAETTDVLKTELEDDSFDNDITPNTLA